MSKLKKHQFYGMYANTKLADRLLVLDWYKHGNQTLNDVYAEIKKLDDIQRKSNQRISELIEQVADYLTDKTLSKPPTKLSKEKHGRIL